VGIHFESTPRVRALASSACSARGNTIFIKTNMSNNWADESEMGEDDGIGGREVQHQPQQRPRLQLKPRSQNPVSATTSEQTTSTTTTSKSNPFGAAKPREEGELIMEV